MEAERRGYQRMRREFDGPEDSERFRRGADYAIIVPSAS
jgi:hypothetical protein